MAIGARAQPPPAVAAAPAPTEVRLGLSTTVADSLTEARLRRFVAIELNGQAALSPGASGPLGDNVVHVWVDLPTPITVLLEARAPGKPVARRLFSIAGLTSEVAARVVAIAVAETVHSQTLPAPAPKKAPPPKPPTPDEIDARDHWSRSVGFGAGVGAAVLPAAHAGLAGPSLSITFREHGAGASLFARYLAGSSTAGSARWLEAGLAADYRINLGPQFRAGAGLAASGAILHLGDAVQTAREPSQDAWSARAAGMLSIEARVARPAWLGLVLEPGAMLRPVPFVDASGGSGVFQGAWIGLDLRLTLETRETR